MELAVGASESATSSLLGKLGSLLAQEYTLISGVRSEIQYMNDELASMHAFVRKLGQAASARAAHDEQTKNWIEQVRDVAYDIEDCVDDFAHRLGRQPRGEGLLVDLRRAWYAMTTLWSRRDIATKIMDLKSRAQDVGERRVRYGVQDPKHDPKDKSGGRGTQHMDMADLLQPPNPRLVGMAKPVGQEEAINGYGKWLTEQRAHQRILTIVGFGGLGKTTMALELQRRFGEKFELRASVQASQKLDLTSLLRDILKQVVPQQQQELEHKGDAGGTASKGPANGIQGWRVKQLKEKLKTQLEHKRYFLLVDDIWSVSSWTDIWESLPKNQNGSSIVVTTRRRLTRRWIAEGFIVEKDGRTVEEVADGTFHELISRNIVRPVEHSSNGKVKACQVHDMILEYILFKSSEENFITVIGGHWLTPTPSNKVRRLSVHSSNPDDVKEKIENMNLSHVRSLTVFENLHQLPSYSFKSVILQVLDLEGCKSLSTSLLEKICKMFHLKYLSLRNTYIKKLPSDIRRLQYLETLDIRETNLKLLPSSVGRLQRMVHFLGGNKSKRPALRFTEAIAKLTALQTLYGIEISKNSTGALGNMHNLTRLRKLSIYNLKDFDADIHKYEDLLSAIEYLSGYSLKSLAIDDGFTGFIDSVASLSTPPKYILSLELSGRLLRVPEWLKDLETLEKLTLSMTSLQTDVLVVLSKLPKLFSLTFSIRAKGQDIRVVEILQTNTVATGGLIFVPGGGFGRLKLLRFTTPMMPLLSFLEGAMPELQRLELQFRILEGLYGLENLRYIQQVHLRVSQQASEATMVKVSDVRSSVSTHKNKPTVVVDEYHE
ncbi:hypothetical protein HU200_048828 [Digitaria exilis]|uniref:Uncharacterized protein n=1 Tax=Digitaria exilis TaxID=1010633 RepID=A0A835AX19_9POAL|nr:hypothetical protein HU200_048828 [Digitaria exilis]